MTPVITVAAPGPLLSVQDLGRVGFIQVGLSRGGAMDRVALLEAAALLGARKVGEAIEMAGMGGIFTTSAAVRFALTGAPMSATIDGVPVVWNASHSLNPGQKLRIGGALEGTYGYLSFAGGIATQAWLGSRAAHLTAGIGKALEAGDTLPLNADPSPEMAPCIASVLRRYHGGIVRVMPGPQTHLFDQDTRDRFAATEFTRSAKANRQGVALDQSGAPFSAENARTILSDFIVPGDVQMTGDGTPYILMSECQTIGGYPRIGTVLPLDMPIAAQAPVGAPIRFEWITEDEAAGLYQSEDAILAQVRAKVRPLFRNPADIHDLLSYQLISGMTRGDELERAD